MLELRDLTVGYGPQVLFRGLSMDIRHGAALAVLGANGTGKSSFLKVLLGVLPPIFGTLHWPSGPPAQIGYLAQMTTFDRRFPLQVRDLAAMGMWGGLWGGRLDRDGQRRVDAALDTVGILDIARQSLHSLSAGQLQRALFARVIVQDAPLILLDEPFTAVDQSTEAHLLTLIDRWRQENRALVLVVHDLSAVLDHCNAALLLGGGTATHGPVDAVLTPKQLVAQNYMSQSQAAWMLRSMGAGA